MRMTDPRIGLSLLLALAIGCGGGSSTGDAGSTTAPAATTGAASTASSQGGGGDSVIDTLTGVVAKVSGVDITYSQLDEKAAARLVRLKTQAYDIRKQTLDEMIDTQLLEAEAKKRGITVDELVAAEAKGAEVSDEEARAFFEKNPPRGEVDYERMKDRIKDYLQKKNEADGRSAFIGGLRAAAGVEIFLEPLRFDVAFADADPVKGSKVAPIQIVEYSDFQCPYCSRVNPTLAQVQETYGDKVAIAFRNYPLPMHKDAPRAGAAGYCAQDQGKFWEFHDVLFENQRAQTDDDLKKYAAEVGLAAADFEACLTSNKYAERVEADRLSGEMVGVSGTPAFFINGVFVNGARPFEAFAEVIDEEIARKSL